MIVTKIKMVDIKPPSLIMRQKIGTNAIHELVESIIKIGLINPISVKKTKGKYEILAGHRRYLAYAQLQYTEIDCIEFKVDEAIQTQIQLDENVIRADISAIDEAIFFQSVIKRLDCTQTELAAKIGKSSSYINERLAILDYSPALLTALKEEQISFSVAREFHRVKDLAKQRDFINFAILDGCNPRIARQWVMNYNRDIENRLSLGQVGDNQAIAPASSEQALLGTCGLSLRVKYVSRI